MSTRQLDTNIHIYANTAETMTFISFRHRLKL